MKKPTNYLLLSALFFVAYLALEFTSIYGDSGWFKFFALLVSATFLISGIAQKSKK